MTVSAHQFDYTLPSQLTAETAEPLTEALLKLASLEGFRLALDASNVEHLTACGAQVLASLQKTADTISGEIAITGQPPFFNAALEDMGLSWLAATVNA